MSADNWAVCPFCKMAALDELAELQRQVDDGYGVLSVPEWDALRERVAKGIDERSLTTFREDYEIYGATSATINVSYSGHCATCGAGVDFQHSVPVREGTRKLASR